jgi:hypothetical protein
MDSRLIKGMTEEKAIQRVLTTTTPDPLAGLGINDCCVRFAQESGE